MGDPTVFRAAIAVVGLAGGAMGSLWLLRAPEGPAPTPKVSEKEHAGMRTSAAPRYSKSGYDITPLSPERIDLLAKRLTPEQRAIVLAKGTEAPFCGTLLDNKKTGVYVCSLCELPLFASDSKFHSGTGWPSFFQPVDPDHVASHADDSYGMHRVEITCARCGAHLGHVFDDGPNPTGLRFCVNSESLEFYEQGQDLPPAAMPVKTETAYFAGGCFWGIEHHFESVPGVIDAVSGFQGGEVEDPSYQQVCADTTGHAETVRVTYDPARVTYRQLLRAFFAMHDPTQLNRQGPDFGEQYRSAIFAVGDDQLAEARAYIDTLAKAGVYKGKIVTQVVPAEGHEFFAAEDYHQDYVARTGRACHAMRPLTDLPE
ncbi:MAG: bifunctional methionine sulfoxide reductase B/A protein [Phycisphaerales bacterium]